MPKEVEDDKQNAEADGDETAAPREKVEFPWLALCAAIFFDLIGMIPILNFFSEAFAGLAFGFWQKLYAPKTNPVITFIVAKIADGICLGLLPSNIAIVVFAYIKKRAASLLKDKAPAAAKALESTA